MPAAGDGRSDEGAAMPALEGFRAIRRAARPSGRRSAASLVGLLSRPNRFVGVELIVTCVVDENGNAWQRKALQAGAGSTRLRRGMNEGSRRGRQRRSSVGPFLGCEAASMLTRARAASATRDRTHETIAMDATTWAELEPRRKNPQPRR